MDNFAIYSYVACRLKNKIAPAIIQPDIERDIGLKICKDAIYEFIYRFRYIELIEKGGNRSRFCHPTF